MTSKPTINTPVGNVEGISKNIAASNGTAVFPAGEDGIAVLYCSGNATGHTVWFEGTLDGTNWFTMQAMRLSDSTLVQFADLISSNSLLAYALPLYGVAAFRLRATTLSSGVATWTASYEEEASFPGLATAVISGTTNVGVGASASRITSAGAAGVARASQARLTGWVLTNTSAGVRYVHLYNKATTATLGTDTPLVTIALAAGQAISLEQVAGVAFTGGIAWAVTTDNGAIPAVAAAAGDVTGTLMFT